MDESRLPRSKGSKSKIPKQKHKVRAVQGSRTKGKAYMPTIDSSGIVPLGKNDPHYR